MTRLVSVEQQLRQVLAELELVSHVSAVNLESSGGDHGEDIGGRRPPGGIDRRDDLPDNHERHHPQKSVDHFRRRLARARSDESRTLILGEAKDALTAWKRQPALTGEPEYGTPQWKRWVAESDLSSSKIADKYGVSGQYVRKIRAEYRDAA
jgi:hypothetical protein